MPKVKLIENLKYYKEAPVEVKEAVTLWSSQNPETKLSGALVVQIAMQITDPPVEVIKYINTFKPKFLKGNTPTIEVESLGDGVPTVKAYMRLSRGESLDENGFQRQQRLISGQFLVTHWFSDVISGAVRSRPSLNRLLEGLQEGDIVVIPSIDRLSRSTADLLGIVDSIKEKGAVLKSINEPWLDTSTDNPMSEFLLTVMGALNQMERRMITERIQQGVDIAKEKGVKFGRPLKNGDQVQHAIDLYKKGEMSTREIEKSTGVSRSTLMRRVRELKQKGEI